MSQNFGSGKKKWRDQSHSQSSNRRYHPQRPCNQGYATQRGGHNGSSHDHWRRPDYRGYENNCSNNFAAESSAVETGGAGGTTPGVGIFITPYYTGFGNAQNGWKSGYGYNGFQNNKLDASGEIPERWQSSQNTNGEFISPHRNGPSGGSWSSNGGRSNDQRRQNGNLRNVPYSFHTRGGRSRTSYSTWRPTDQKLIKEGDGSEVASAVESERVKASRSSSAIKTAGKETSVQDPEAGNHSVAHSKVENGRRSDSKVKSSKSESKMQNNKHLKDEKPTKMSKAASDKARIPSLLGLSSQIPVLAEHKARHSKRAPKIGSKSQKVRKLSKVPNIRQEARSSLSSRGHTASQEIQDSSDGNAQTTQVGERTKQKNSSVPSVSGTAQETSQSSETECRSVNAGVRPKVDIVMRKKRSSGLSKGDLMKLISSPRSRQEHMQLNRILQAHAEKQKTSMQHAAMSETEEHEEPSSDHSGFFKDIEVSALPLEIQREIDILCQGITDVNPSEHSNNVIDLSDIAEESLSVPTDSPSRNAASSANARLQDSAQQHSQGASACRVSATVSQSQCSSSEVRSRNSSSGCLMMVEETPGMFSIPSVSRITCQPNVSHSPSVSTGVTRSCDNQSDLPVTESSIISSATAVASGVTICSTSLTQRMQSPTSASTNCQNIVNESRSDQGGTQSLGTLLQISLREEEIRSRLKETEVEITSLEEQFKQLKEQLSVKLSLKHELTEEKVRLRSLRLQILRESVSHQQEDSSGAVTPVTERLANVPYESIMEVSPSRAEYNPPDQNIPPSDSDYGFDSVLRNGVINIEPVNDDYESGLCYGESVCPQYENGGTVQLITIAPTEGGDFSDDDERMQGNSSNCERSAAAVLSVDSAQSPDPSAGLQHHNDVQVLPEEMNNTVSVHMEYVGTLSTSNLQPEVLQQIALSLQPLDAQRVPFHSSCVASSPVHEFSCSEDEAVERSGSDDRTLEPSGTKKGTVEPNSANKKKTVDPITGCPSQPVSKETDDCVISRVEKPVSRKPNRGISESEQTAGSALTAASGRVLSHRRSILGESPRSILGESPRSILGESPRSILGESPRAVARAQRQASTSRAIPVVTEIDSSDTVCNLVETLRAIRQSTTPRPSSAKGLPPIFSTGNGPVPSFDRMSYRDRSEATIAMEKCKKDASKRRSTEDPIARKRKGAISPKEPPAKRKKSLENPGEKKTVKRKRMAFTSIYPRVYPGVLYRHAESARSIVLSDEVVITASDDGQIVRHPLPRQVYGLAEKQIFTGHERGVVGLITTKVQVTRDISRTVALSIGRDQLLKMHCIQTGKVLMTHKFDKIVCYDSICEANNTVYVGLDDGNVARITTSSFVIKEPFIFLGSRISALATFADDLRLMLLVGFGDCTISVRDASNNFLIQTLRGHVRAPRFILTLNDRIISSSGDCCVFIHCLKNFNTLVNTLHLPSPVVAMTIQAKHELLVVACRNRTVTFIDIKENLRYITRLSTIEYPLTCLAASHHMVYFGCNNGLVHHIDIDTTRHWSCGFIGCKDWFLLKGDLEDHIREDHVGSNLPVIVNGQHHNICSWHGCRLPIPSKKRRQKTLAHFLSHIATLEPETTPRRSAVTN